jgi:hypothetical protein
MRREFMEKPPISCPVKAQILPLAQPTSLATGSPGGNTQPRSRNNFLVERFRKMKVKEQDAHEIESSFNPQP